MVVFYIICYLLMAYSFHVLHMEDDGEFSSLTQVGVALLFPLWLLIVGGLLVIDAFLWYLISKKGFRKEARE